MAGFTERKRALHDMAAGALVVDRWAWTDHPELQKRELGGCLIPIIIAAILMVLVSVGGILAAIALPAYQDYTLRAKVAQAAGETAPLRLMVADFSASEGRCPSNGEGGIGAEDSLGGAYASGVAVGGFDDGTCGVELELDGTGHTGIDGGQIWWQLGADGQWTCSSSVEDRWLSQECRG
jgi:type IV pilus assembly protein PilA